MQIKSLVVIVVLATAILCSGGLVNAQAIDTATLIVQLQAQIASLLAQIATLQAQQGTTTAWCYTFNTNLKFGDVSGEASYLKSALKKEGLQPYIDSSYTAFNNDFDEDLASAVIAFQAKYGIRQTGYVGPSTRAKLNALYGCGTTTAAATTTTTTTVTATTTTSPSAQIPTVFNSNGAYVYASTDPNVSLFWQSWESNVDVLNPRIYINGVDNVPFNDDTTATKFCTLVKGQNFVSGTVTQADSWVYNGTVNQLQWTGSAWAQSPTIYYVRRIRCSTSSAPTIPTTTNPLVYTINGYTFTLGEKLSPSTGGNCAAPDGVTPIFIGSGLNSGYSNNPVGAIKAALDSGVSASDIKFISYATCCSYESAIYNTGNITSVNLDPVAYVNSVRQCRPVTVTGP